MAWLLLGVLFVLGAEALAVVALALKDPPEVMAVLILAGVGVLLLAMLAVFVDSLLRATLEGSPSNDESPLASRALRSGAHASPSRPRNV